jgi:L-ascorbate metabolism protein UlaG (beta-lactamase superfamily)
MEIRLTRHATLLLAIHGHRILVDPMLADGHAALREYAPAIAVVNAGAAQFLEGGPITMTADDVIAVAGAAPSARVVAVHMEAIDHCVLRRADLAAAVDRAGLTSRVVIPADGERVPAQKHARTPCVRRRGQRRHPNRTTPATCRRAVPFHPQNAS